MQVNKNLYPKFWMNIRKGFKTDKINYSLTCPMNYLSEIRFKHVVSKGGTLPMSVFFNQFKLKESRRRSKKVETLIEKYSLEVYEAVKSEDADYLLLRSDFEELIEDIKRVYISKEYAGLYSWLINRAFQITSGVKSKSNIMNSKTNNNKALLLKVLYTVNPDMLLQVFAKNTQQSEQQFCLTPLNR